MSTFTGRLGLVRHGQTYANIDGVWHGHTDTALTELGENQAKKLGEYFHNYMKPDIIFASPLQRARRTAEAVAHHFDAPLHIDDRLMEFGLGDWEGRTFESLLEGDNIIKQIIENKNFLPPNGESHNMVKARVLGAIEEITKNNADKNVLVVAHGVALSIVISHFTEGDSIYWEKYSKNNTAFSELCLKTNKLLTFNLTDHL